jgi:hypothetical protein
MEQLRKNYVGTYDLQMMLMNAVAAKHGDLNRIVNVMREKIPEKKRLSDEGDRLRNEEQAFGRTAQEQYAAFKGMTGVTLDYVEPPATGGSATAQ